MELSQETIDAVHAHDAAEKKKKDDAARAESLRRFHEWSENMDRQLREKVRAVWPEATDEQVDQLEGIYREHAEMDD